MRGMDAFDRRAGAALYGDDPDAYERGRLQYPERVYEVIADHGVGPGVRAVEIGPAIGLVTGRLLATGADVTAIELTRPPHDRRRILDDLRTLVEDDFGAAVERTFVTAMYTGKRR